MDKRNQTATNYHLRELGDSKYEVAKGEPDIRGWKVADAQGNLMGKVKELLCDPEALKVRYLILDLEGNVLDLEPRDIMVPIGLAELHEADDVVTVPNLSAEQIQALPRYEANLLNQETERLVQRIFVGDHVHGTSPAPARQPQVDSQEYYSQEHFNQNNLYRNRKAKNVIGLFSDAGSVQRVLSELFASGFKKEDIEVAMRSSPGSTEGYSQENFERFFYSLFATPEEAMAHQAKMQNSNALVVVHAYSQDEANRAAHLLDSHRNSELDIEIERTTSAPSNTSPVTSHLTESTSESTSIPVIEEQLQVGKQEVETGRTRVHQIVERPIGENVRLREERIQMERVPVDRPAAGADFASFQEGSFELKEYAEVPVISKEAHVVEEITIGKDVEVREELIQETVKKTEIQVEDLRTDEIPREDGTRIPPTASGI
ncbi:DUF2382 domain-containing protein [Rufibacter latericius]|uniref:DUF2382 domain-containing protein n=1 Tax=Rufibacter latericius TaxID=2487040 RepID=A0A3M9M946_9BACT|nr:PRC and DUF2382 domain-containing protein [Rufibacter latericius]RNI22006.1 DUF2382 domain-containing protein [Rufibacter latericius]